MNAETIQARWREVRARVDQAARDAGRAPSHVRLIAVSKRHPVTSIAAAFEAGARDFGESRVQEWVEKAEALPGLIGEEAARHVRWHFIGRLQSRKAKHLGDVACLHSLDRSSLLDALERRDGAVLPVLVQVNIGREASKGGVMPEDVTDFVARARASDALDVRGLMVLPPLRDDAEATRADFDALAQLRDRVRADLGLSGDALPELSMGMSGDYPLAVAAGSTMVRVGTAIFGARG